MKKKLVDIPPISGNLQASLKNGLVSWYFFSYGWSVGRLVSWYFLAMVGQLVLFNYGWSVGGWSVGGWSVGRLVSSPSIVIFNQYALFDMLK